MRRARSEGSLGDERPEPLRLDSAGLSRAVVARDGLIYDEAKVTEWIAKRARPVDWELALFGSTPPTTTDRTYWLRPRSPRAIDSGHDAERMTRADQGSRPNTLEPDWHPVFLLRRLAAEGVPSESRETWLRNNAIDVISTEPIQDPVVLSDGHVYERENLERWSRTSRALRSLYTNLKVPRRIAYRSPLLREALGLERLADEAPIEIRLEPPPPPSRPEQASATLSRATDRTLGQDWPHTSLCCPITTLALGTTITASLAFVTVKLLGTESNPKEEFGVGPFFSAFGSLLGFMVTLAGAIALKQQLSHRYGRPRSTSPV